MMLFIQKPLYSAFRFCVEKGVFSPDMCPVSTEEQPAPFWMGFPPGHTRALWVILGLTCQGPNLG